MVNEKATSPQAGDTPITLRVRPRWRRALRAPLTWVLFYSIIRNARCATSMTWNVVRLGV